MRCTTAMVPVVLAPCNGIEINTQSLVDGLGTAGFQPCKVHTRDAARFGATPPPPAHQLSSGTPGRQRSAIAPFWESPVNNVKSCPHARHQKR